MGLKDKTVTEKSQKRISGIIIDFDLARTNISSQGSDKSFFSWISKEIVLHARRIFVIILNLIFNQTFTLSLIGKINKRFKFLQTVFVAYPATEQYTKAYVYPSWKEKLKWRPGIAGVYRQDGKWGLMTIISTTEKDFLSKHTELANLRKLVANVERMNTLLYAPQKSFAGILPGVLYSKNLINDAPETAVTVEVILKAIDNLIDVEGCSLDTPVIVLGGKGFVGRRLVDRLKYNSLREVISIDLENCNTAWPLHLRGKRAILINVTKKTAIKDYILKFWPELIVLNETYPEPSRFEIEAISQIGCNIYHIVGVAAKSYPSFPRAYHGGIPCCAAWNAPTLKALIKKLN